MTFRSTRHAVQDVEECIAWSAAKFGKSAARRYQKLIATAIKEIAAKPDLSGSREIKGLQRGIRLYHLRHSRKRAVVGGHIVKRPRHFIVYKVLESGIVEIIRLLHDSMELESHLSESVD